MQNNGGEHPGVVLTSTSVAPGRLSDTGLAADLIERRFKPTPQPLVDALAAAC